MEKHEILNQGEQEQKQESGQNQTEAALEYGPCFLWILVSVTAGGLAIVYIVFNGYEMAYGLSASLGGIIGGIFVGFMPWLAQKREISRTTW